MRKHLNFDLFSNDAFHVSVFKELILENIVSYSFR